jgi:hypothetical protein
MYITSPTDTTELYQWLAHIMIHQLQRGFESITDFILLKTNENRDSCENILT